jgi:hypothetical protein
VQTYKLSRTCLRTALAATKILGGEHLQSEVHNIIVIDAETRIRL